MTYSYLMHTNPLMRQTFKFCKFMNECDEDNKTEDRFVLSITQLDSQSKYLAIKIDLCEKSITIRRGRKYDGIYGY